MASNAKVYTSRRLIDNQTVNLIDGKAKEAFIKAANFGFKQSGEVVTTKGINQIEALSIKGKKDVKVFVSRSALFRKTYLQAISFFRQPLRTQ